MASGDLRRAGRLSEESLPRLLQRVFCERLTGGVALALPTGAGAIYLRDGQVAAVELPGVVDRLGDLLIASKVIDEKRLESTIALVGEGPVGRALVDSGFIVDSQLIGALRLQARRRLHRLFFVEEAEFNVEIGEHGWGVEGDEEVRIHPHRAIYQGMKSAYREDRFGREIPQRALRLAATPEQLALYGIVDADQVLITRLAERPHTAAELAVDLGLPLEGVRAVVYALLVTEALQVAAHSPSGPQAPQAQPAQAAATGARIGSPPSVPPSMHAGPRAVQAAGSAPGRDPRRSTPPAAPSVPPANAAESLARQIAEKLARIDSEDLFQVLGLGRDANRAAVKAAFLEAARTYHPDRLTALGLSSLKAGAEKIFRRVSEANATLSDDARRAAFLDSLQSAAAGGAGGVDPQRIVAAEMAFLEGELALKRRDYDTAIARLAEAVELNPDEGEAVALLAWARSSAGRAELSQFKWDFQRAVKLSPECARAHYFLGMAWKQGGDMNKAVASFRRAVEIDERLAEAQSELRVLRMRSHRDDPGSKGLLDRLRKK